MLIRKYAPPFRSAKVYKVERRKRVSAHVYMAKTRLVKQGQTVLIGLQIELSVSSCRTDQIFPKFWKSAFLIVEVMVNLDVR
jgi:hypothetical protein